MYDKTGNVIDRREMLRVKIKSLAEEARIIRKETDRLSGRKRHRARFIYRTEVKALQKILKDHPEKLKEAIQVARTEMRKELANARPRTWGPLHAELLWHRTWDLRNAARNAHVAYGIIRGRPLEKIETAPKSDPNWEEVARLVKKYGPAKGVELPERAKAKLAPKA